MEPAAARRRDLDLLLVRDDDVDPDGPWADQVHSSGEQLEAWTGNTVQFVQLSRSQLAVAVAEEQPLITGLRADGRVLVGPVLRELLRAGARA